MVMRFMTFLEDHLRFPLAVDWLAGISADITSTSWESEYFEA
jgi:hypothetical protein